MTTLLGSRMMTSFEAAEIAMDRAVASPETAGARKLEGILGGNGEWTAEVAYREWQKEMGALGFDGFAGDEGES